jgi:hypothetical protein
VLRGGYWGDIGTFARVTRRISLTPDVRAPDMGFASRYLRRSAEKLAVNLG